MLGLSRITPLFILLCGIKWLDSWLVPFCRRFRRSLSAASGAVWRKRGSFCLSGLPLFSVETLKPHLSRLQAAMSSRRQPEGVPGRRRRRREGREGEGGGSSRRGDGGRASKRRGSSGEDACNNALSWEKNGLLYTDSHFTTRIRLSQLRAAHANSLEHGQGSL